ncbi:DNA-binding transcriptional regulator, FadR family [Microbacterium pygmaeum]|uniref:DNA-binding transcriptional regulator, FadR family n=2 Tax=Microbacterium pygmaeum TaxID=370764 RepID=A0A1G7XE50_9MICO|nr:DNA-binding transcriptional regulator, FadR family [Microbacterium pygmaeum]
MDIDDAISNGASQSRIIGQKVLRPRQQVEELLRKAILSGQVRATERLPAETELARQFSVSRPTIREALSALESQGLIFKVPGAGGGSFVQTVDHHALGQVVQESMHNLLSLGSVSFAEVSMVRQYLEVPAVALAAINRTDDDLEELDTIMEEQRTRSVDDPMIADLDARFHIAIARMSGNRILASLVYALHSESEPVSYLDLSPDVGRETFAQHRSIVKAIAAGDPLAGEVAIAEHLTYLREHLKAREEAQRV